MLTMSCLMLANARRMTEALLGPIMISSPRMDSNASYGLYALIDVQTSGAVNPAIADRWVHSWTLDDVEEYLKRP